MSTEKSTHDTRHSRRSSFGSDLDAPVITYQQTRHRANSSENLLREDYSTKSKDNPSSVLPRGAHNPAEQRLPSFNKNDRYDTVSDSNYRRPSSPIRFEATNNNNRHQSILSQDEGKHRPIAHNGNASHGTGVSAMVEIPVVMQPKRSDPVISQIVSPTMPIRDDQRNRSRSPSPSLTSLDSYRRQSSHEQSGNVNGK
jgi:hypothetical protein